MHVHIKVCLPVPAERALLHGGVGDARGRRGAADFLGHRAQHLRHFRGMYVCIYVTQLGRKKNVVHVLLRTNNGVVEAMCLVCQLDAHQLDSVYNLR